MQAQLEEVFNESYERTLGSRVSPKLAEEVLSSFYDRFTGSSDEVAEKFSNTDMARQRQMLHQSIVYLVNYFATRSAGDVLHRIGVMHDREHYNIDPHLYDLWLEALIQTIAEYDPRFDEHVGRAWREVMAPGMAYMRSLYQHE